MVTAAPETPGAAPEAAPKAQGAWARWRGPVLFVSLGLNLFLVGAFAGGWWHHHQPRPWRQAVIARHMGPTAPMAMPGRPGEPGAGPMRPGMGAIGEAVRQLPEAERKPFEEAMAQRRPAVQDLQQEVRRARLKVNDAIRAEPFDRKAMADALAAVREKILAMQAKLHEGLVEGVSRLPADKRRDFAESLAAIRSRP